MDDNTQQQSTGSSSMNPMLLFGIAAVVVIVVIGAGILMYSKAQKSPSVQNSAQQPTQAMMQNQGMTESPTQAMAASPGTMENIQQVTIEGFNFGFTPKTITVKKGQKVQLTFKNTAGTHSLVIDEFNVKTDIIQTGQTTTVEFTPDKTGTFTYYCPVDSHKAMGMEGTLTVN